ncbi:glycoside hydrolase family 88 protein [Catenovulum adriaticum]|uniref:Glycoside hydrolase family 88 protein n=1 Tax=Catenovulum adriaticum TaxID=2984846 RepID=A0ABY7ARU6_9ALTE|nr:glycoside hydrolase family 88 protein [Catenovulum sp. TS8]WAJ72258.1 glycoside hydrolase family 88 protein [Catenovulum sp. TS8]
MKKRISLSLSLAFGLLACGEQVTNENINPVKPKAVAESPVKADSIFTEETAKQNLTFIKNQYLKMLHQIDSESGVDYAKGCLSDDLVCYPRALEHDKIYMEKPEKWTNGFFPGVLWKLLAAKSDIQNFTPDEQQTLLKQAKFYQAALIPEAKRGSTHDLGFILYDSFGEAIDAKVLSEQELSLYQQTLDEGRRTLVTRFDQEKGVIKSWDFLAKFPAHYIKDNKIKKTYFNTQGTWQYPVIVDNMMNLEFLFTSDNKNQQNIAYQHAKQTYLNHYFYQDNDVNKDYPIAYHVYDYASDKPGNWQGLGNVSAWARGQGWSLYGFVTVLEFFKQQAPELTDLPDFEQHVEKLVRSVERLMATQNAYVPDWDFFAAADNAQQLAENQSKNTLVYHRVLDLCDFEIADNILPYKGYRPIQFSADLLAESDLNKLSQLTSVYHEPFVQGEMIAPCGTQAYQDLGTHIPKDSSAAALMAAALYRLAQITESASKKTHYIEFADKIMNELSNQYLTSKTQNKSYQQGFVLTHATGNLPNGSEIDTAIVYADFYFLEANMRKLALAGE